MAINQNIFLCFPTMESTNFYLREIKDCDYLDIQEIYDNKFLHQYSNVPYIEDRQDSKDLIFGVKESYYKNQAILWCVEDKVTSECVGIVNLSSISESSSKGEIGFGLKEVKMNQGIMEEVITEISTNLIDIYLFNRIEANVNIDNTTQIDVYNTAGFTLEGERNDYLYNEEFDIYMDCYIFAKVKT